MNDQILKNLQSAHAEAYAKELQTREEVLDAIGIAYQNPTEAVSNFQWALGRWGINRTIDIAEQQPARFGTPRGAWYSRDGWTLGGKARSDASQDAIAQIPGLLRSLEQAENRERVTRAAYERYCREHNIDPERPWQYDPRSAGAARVPEHLAPERDGDNKRVPSSPERTEAEGREPEEQNPEPRHAPSEREDHLDWVHDAARDEGRANEPVQTEVRQPSTEDHLDWLRDDLEQDQTERDDERERERER